METKASQIDCHLKVGKVLLLAVKCYSAYSYNPTFTLYSRRMTDKSAGKYNLSLQPPTSNESNHQVEAEEPSSKKKKRKRKNKDQTNAPFPSTSNESNHQVEAEEPSSKKEKRKRNSSSKLSKEKKR